MWRFIFPLLCFSTISHSSDLTDFIKLHLGDNILIITTLNYLDERISSALLNDTFTKTFVDPSMQNFEEHNFSYILFKDTVTGQDLEFLNRLDTKSKFLIVFEHESDKEILKDCFKKLWNLNVHNVVALVNWTEFTTWFPYGPESQCGNQVTLSKFVKYQAIPKNLRGCKLKLLWEPISLFMKNPPDGSDCGIGLLFMNTVAKQMNISLEYVKSNTHYVIRGSGAGNYDHIKDLMDNRTVDMAVTIFRDFERTQGLECTLPFTLSPTYVLLPPRKKIDTSISLLGAFSGTTWAVAVALSATTAIVWKFLTKTSFESSAFVICQAVLQCQIQNIPKQIHFRIVSFSFVLYSMNLNALYLSKESSILTQPNFEPKIKNLEQFLRTNVPLNFVRDSARTLVQSDLLDVFVKRNINDGEDARNFQLIQQFIANPHYGLVIHSTSVYYFRNPEQLEIFTDKRFFNMMLNAHCRKNYPLLDKVNVWTLRIQESGFEEKWLYDSTADFKKITIPSPDIQEKNPMNLIRLQNPFVILLVGLSVSAVVFCLELIYLRALIN